MNPTSQTRRFARLSTLLLFSLTLSSQALAVGYTITDLGAGLQATGINNNGQVVGYAYTATYSPFLYSNGTMTYLGTFGGQYSQPSSVNNNGQVVGYSNMPNGKPRGFIYSNGALTDIGTLGGQSSFASDINQSGQVSGTSYLSGDYISHAFVYSNGVMTDIGTLGGMSSRAGGINKYGQVVGSSFTSTNISQHAFYYSNGTMSDLGTFGGTNSAAMDINDNSQIVGSAKTANNVNHAFLFSNGAMIDLGASLLPGWGSAASRINNIGQVLINANSPNFMSFANYLYENGNMYDINTLLPSNSGWSLQGAYDINDYGQIVGIGTLNGQGHAFLMTPTATVPVPAAAWLLGTGLLSLINVARRKTA